MSQLRTNSIVPVGGIPAGASGGGIIQVVQTVKSDSFSASATGTYVAVTGLSATITPRSTSNKILIIATVGHDGANNYQPWFHIYRGGSRITPDGPSTGLTPSTSYTAAQSPADTRSMFISQTFEYLDSPASTSALTYQIYGAKDSRAVTSLVVNPYGSSIITLMEVSG